MTQTQDEQNVQTPVESTPDLSAVDVAPEAQVSQSAPEEVAAPETPVSEPAAPVVEQPESNSQPEVQTSVIQEWMNTVKDSVRSGVDAIADTWKAWVEQIQQIWENAMNTSTEAVQQTMSTATQAGTEAVQWVVWATNDLKQWISDTFHNAANAGWVIEWGKAVVQGTVGTTAQVAEKAVWSTVSAAEWLVGGTVWAAENVVSSASSVVQNSVNTVAWKILPEAWAQKIADFQNKVSQGAQNLWTQARDTLQETWQKAKWFFAGLRDNFKSGFSTKNANDIMQQASAPLEHSEQPVAPEAQQPAVPVAQQPAAPVAQQPAAPVVEQPATPEVQPGDVQQPTQTNPVA